MSAIIRYLCYGITALAILATVIGVAAGDAPTVKLGLALAGLFGILSALLQVKRLF
jgi:hypothetical protein